MLLSQYELPSAYELISYPPTKLAWEKEVYNRINTYWLQDLKQQASNMSTAALVNTDKCEVGKVADVWCHNSDPVEARMASVKCRIMVQRYPLGYSYCAGNRKAKTCTLCGEDEETITHFLLVCPILATSRTRHLSKLKSCLLQLNLVSPELDHPETLAKLILTPCLFVPTNKVPMLEQITRRLVYSVHCARSSHLGRKLNFYSGRISTIISKKD